MNPIEARIHLANAALITDPRIWPGEIVATHNTLGDIAKALGVGIQYHPIRTLGTALSVPSQEKARIASAHQGFRGEKYPWHAIRPTARETAMVATIYALHHYGPASTRRIEKLQKKLKTPPLPTTIYLQRDSTPNSNLGKQTVQLSRSDLKGVGLLSGDNDPITSEKIDEFLKILAQKDFQLCIDTLHTHSLLTQSGLNWQSTLDYLLNQQQICQIGEVHTSAGRRTDFSGDISQEELETFYQTLRDSKFSGHITIEAPLHVLTNKRLRTEQIPAIYRPIVQQIRDLAI